MEDKNAWIESRLAAAIKGAATEPNVIPPQVTKAFQELLSGDLQQPLKQAELEKIAATLIDANRSDS